METDAPKAHSVPAPVSHLLPASIPFTSLAAGLLRPVNDKIRTLTDADECRASHLHRSSFSFAGQETGRPREIALGGTLCFDIACSNHLMVSPPLRGSNPYPCGSLTYRIYASIVKQSGRVCQWISANFQGGFEGILHGRKRISETCGRSRIMPIL